jgi:hypothetical protein
MRVKYHEIEGQEQVAIRTADEPGSGGAHHKYVVEDINGPFEAIILFQDGPVPTSGLNGVTHEALIAICMHRLDCFQAGPFACRENAQARVRLQEALDILKGRTMNRLKRNVEGKEKA